MSLGTNFRLLDGTAATVDVALAVSGTATASLRCIVSGATYESTRSFQSQQTLCSGKWVRQSPANNQDILRISKFESQGDPISDFSGLMTGSAAANVVLTLETGNTKSGTFWLARDSFSLAAGAQGIPGVAELVSDGPVATVRVTS
jgi:hypothetical protein